MNTPDESIDIEKYRRKKAQENFLKNYQSSVEQLHNHNAVAKERFLLAWKKGIKKIGSQFFTIKDNIDNATDKWQLAPNFEIIDTTFNGCSHPQQALLGLMYSFYDSEYGQKLLDRANTSNYVDALAVLDLEGREIISELWMYYDGW